MNDQIRVAAAGVARLVLYGLLSAAIVELIFLDAHLHGASDVLFQEDSLVELTQALLLALMTAILAFSYLRQEAFRSSALLMGTFTLTSLIRENDSFLDQFYKEGWEALVIIVIVPGLIITWRNRVRLFDELRLYNQSLSCGVFLSGLMTTYVFSRLYGTTVLWREILDERFDRSIKNLSEECIELFGYGLLIIAVIEFVMLAARLDGERRAGLRPQI